MTDFLSRAEKFKKAVERAEKRYGVSITAGYLNPSDDDDNLIIKDAKVYGDRVYYRTLSENEGYDWEERA